MRKTAIITNESKFIKADGLLFDKPPAKVFVILLCKPHTKYFQTLLPANIFLLKKILTF